MGNSKSISGSLGFFYSYLMFMVLWSFLFLYSAQGADLLSDTWVATDELGRELPGYEECGGPRSGRYVGMFYFLWLGQHSTSGPHDITKLLAADPLNPAWGPRWHFHHWGEPELGYYISDDPYVMRRHVSMLSDAGVDVLILDVTNGFTYENVYQQLCSVFSQILSEGGTVPQICFLAHSNAVDVVQGLYDSFYGANLYPELWFYWKGKPLILSPLAGHSQQVEDFFTMRDCWAWTDGEDTWNWLDHYPQGYGWHELSSIAEETSVCVAQHATSNIGRSFHNGSQPSYNIYGLTGTEHLGLCFSEQWQRVFGLDPEFVFVTGWNEWVAQRFICGQDSCPGFLGLPTVDGQSWFVDQYNHEYSRDIEPMKGGHTDNYYYQLVSNIRKYKGVRPLPSGGPAQPIIIDGDFTDWGIVSTTYYDTLGDTGHRDWPGWGALHYTNTTGRNDIIACKIAHDAYQIYFYVETREAITPYSDPYWMQLYIDSDGDNNTGWEGYDYYINRYVTTSTTSLGHSTGGWDWITEAKLSYKISGNKMEIAVPRILIGQQNKRKIAFDFHWADNIRQEDDINEFSLNGDSAPNRRFNYRYEKETPGYYFETDGDFEGWSLTHSMGNGIVVNGSLGFDVTGPDPYMVNWTPMNIEALSYRYLHVRMKNSTSGETAEFYWTTQNDSQIDENKVVRFSIVGNDNAYRDYWVDLSEHAEWTGIIALGRLDPTTASSGHVDIDLIRIQDRQSRCGDFGYPFADVGGPGSQRDCCVGNYDLGMIAEKWLSYDPIVDFTGTGGVPDGWVSLYDFAFLAEQWLNCTFTGTEMPRLPGKASNPNPYDDAMFVNTSADLNWTDGTDATFYDVYFGTNSPGTFRRKQSATTYDPGIMAYSTKYYWRIDSVNSWGKTTGKIWTFTTVMTPPP